MTTDGANKGILVDYDYCLTSFLALRHVYRRDVAWSKDAVPVFARRDFDELTPVHDAEQMDELFARRLQSLDPETTGVLLSGGMDSAITSSYLPRGTRAFTFRFSDRDTFSEVEQARFYAERAGLRLVEVPINKSDYLSALPALMRHRNAPVHSIEPQIYKALIMAQDSGVETVVTGENADSLFGGFDGLVASEWSYDDFVRRYSFVDPAQVLVHPAEYREAFDGSRRGEFVDAHHFMSSVFAEESLNSYVNAASLAGITLISPFAEMQMADPLDIARVQRGDSKYLVRELFRRRFDGKNPPDKLPMPRSVGSLLIDWDGPVRREFLPRAADGLRPDQRWMLFALEQFLETLDD
jgi:asparagine synthetase B (glutamine-hydrolysing)